MYRQSEKNFLSSNISPTCTHNMVNFGPLAAEILSLVWGTPGTFSGFRVLAALLHGILVVGVSQTAAFNRGRTYIRQGGHHVGHWPTFLVWPWSVLGRTGSCTPTLCAQMGKHCLPYHFSASKLIFMVCPM